MWKWLAKRGSVRVARLGARGFPRIEVYRMGLVFARCAHPPFCILQEVYTKCVHTDTSMHRTGGSKLYFGYRVHKIGHLLPSKIPITRHGQQVQPAYRKVLVFVAPAFFFTNCYTVISCY